MTFYAITDTKKGRTGIAPTYLQTTRERYAVYCRIICLFSVRLQISYHSCLAAFRPLANWLDFSIRRTRM